ncbi:hypothetical protein AB0H43_23710 [Hamadaea sp. NPDC050747]|uniref:hypothetical protein n=1 Tax=Hamadaea sp. NPDC050747 TaxID=3155789 RepID=UPI00340AF932
MLVRLAAEWTDPFGIAHYAGDVVDIDAITLAELEEQGVVEDVDGVPEDWNGPGEQEEQAEPQWNGPGSADEADGDAGESEDAAEE